MRLFYFILAGTSDEGYKDIFQSSCATARAYAVFYQIGSLFFFLAFTVNSLVLTSRVVTDASVDTGVCLAPFGLFFYIALVLEIIMEVICCILEFVLDEKSTADNVHDIWFVIILPLWLIFTGFFSLLGCSSKKIFSDETHDFTGVSFGGFLSSLFFLFQFILSILNLAEVSVGGSGYSAFSAFQLISELIPAVFFVLFIGFVDLISCSRPSHVPHSYKLSE